MSFSPESFAEHAINILKSQADPQRAILGQTYFKDHVSILGFSAGQFRQIAKELYEHIKPSWTVQEALMLCELMLPDKYLEVKGVAIYVLELYVKSLKIEHLPQIRSWIDKNYCDNWATIDSIGIYIMCPLIGFYPELIEEVINWSLSENPWLRRSSAVAFIKHARKGKHLEPAYKIAKLLLSDKDDLVQKACGWLLKESGKTDLERLEQFLFKHGKQMSRTSLRYAIEKFPETKRKELLVRTR